MKVIWEDVPTRIRTTVEPLVKRWGAVLPRWCETLYVKYTEDDEDSQASTVVLAQYRTMHLYIHPRFMQDDAEEQSQTVLHEFLHVPLGPLCDVFDEYTESTDGDSSLTAWAGKAWHKALEGCVTDLEHGIARLT